MKNSLKKYSIFIIILVFLLNSCFKSKNGFPELPAGNGSVTGSVYSLKTGLPLNDVTVSMYTAGETYSTKTDAEGNYSLETGVVLRGEGYNVQFVLENYTNATRAAVFELPNLRVDLGKVNLSVIEGEDIKITGIVYDDFSIEPLEGVNVTVVNSNNESIKFVTEASGTFELTDKYFYKGSTYAVTISKSNYIASSSVVAVITGITNVVQGNPIHLYKDHGDVSNT